MHITTWEMPKQEGLMRRLLPDHHNIMICCPIPRLVGSARIRCKLIGVKEDVSTGEWLPAPLQMFQARDRHVDPRKGITSAAPEIVQFEMEW